MSVLRLPASWLRGGSSKGIFLRAADLPADPEERDRLLARLLGSPDPYGRQTDGLGSGVSSTSKVVLLSRSQRPDADIDYLFGHVAIESGRIDWSGSCGNLSAAVGPAAILAGLMAAPAAGELLVRIWQVNTAKHILARVPIQDGLPAQHGEHSQDGLAFPGAPIQLDFFDPAGSSSGALFPTGQPCDLLAPEGMAPVPATLIDAANPLVIVAAGDLGLRGDEHPAQLNQDAALLARLEALRCQASVRMGLAPDAQAAGLRTATPKLAWVAPACAHLTQDGRAIAAHQVDLLARTVSMGKVHPGFTGTGTIALGAAAAMPGTVLSRLLGGPLQGRPLRFAHPGGINDIELQMQAGRIVVARLTRSARVLMHGEVWVPA